jgi:putative nucleotidyltransferase with HDIG domain
VGILAEAAAEKIGANPLLARVGAYYHDIGKMRKPQYYIENTKDNANWHERISPHMAALIISSHIKDGVEMAKQHGLPQQIVDMIPQHHGTKMISFFYEMAKKTNDPDLEKLNEADFRYPGPKPQSQEAGILLLADGVEAAVRALKEKTPTRIQQTVESIINKSFVESQLDECDLTLKDLTDIATTFTHILVGIYHQRIEYPRQSTEVAEKDRVLQ